MRKVSAEEEGDMPQGESQGSETLGDEWGELSGLDVSSPLDKQSKDAYFEWLRTSGYKLDGKIPQGVGDDEDSDPDAESF